MDAMEFDGKDLDEALAAAAEATGQKRSELDYELIEGGRKGVFGLGARPVRIRVMRAAPMQAPAAAEAKAMPARPIFEPAASAGAGSPQADMLRRIIAAMGFDLTLHETAGERGIEMVLDGPDRDRLTKGDGELLGALEFVLGRMGRRAWPGDVDIRLTCRGFRSGRDLELVEMARQAAAQVVRSGRPKRFHAMNPYERRVVHVTVREFAGLTTISEGEGFLKRVRVEKIAT